jgi:hypothetical protein
MRIYIIAFCVFEQLAFRLNFLNPFFTILANKMRVDNHIHIREYGYRHAFFSHYVLPLRVRLKATQSFHNLIELFDEGTISQSQVERWFKKFKSGDTNKTVQLEQRRLSGST